MCVILGGSRHISLYPTIEEDAGLNEMGVDITVVWMSLW